MSLRAMAVRATRGSTVKRAINGPQYQPVTAIDAMQRSVSASAAMRQENKDSAKSKQQEEQSRSDQQPNSGPQIPFKGFAGEFMASVRRQFEENKQLKENVKLLQTESQKLSDSDTLKRAKQTLAKARKDSGPAAAAVRKTAQNVKRSVGNVSESVKKTVDAAAETDIGKATTATVKGAARVAGKAVKVTAEATAKAAAPILENPTVQAVSENVSEMVAESASRYGGMTPRHVRQKIRETRLRIHEERMKYIAENPNAGVGMVLHAEVESKWKQTWNRFKDANPLTRSLFNTKRNLDQSDNPLVAWCMWLAENVQDRLGGLFNETETAQTITQLQMLDPTFRLEKFMREAREFLIPELMDAYIGGNMEVLRELCSEGTFNVLTANIKQQHEQGLVSDSRVVDLRNVELVTAKVLESQLPVLVISFATQEIIIFRDRITGEIKFGKEDNIERCTYALVMTIEEGNVNPVTRGWKVIDAAKHESRPTW